MGKIKKIDQAEGSNGYVFPLQGKRLDGNH
jgi:hypothetical protein